MRITNYLSIVFLCLSFTIISWSQGSVSQTFSDSIATHYLEYAYCQNDVLTVTLPAGELYEVTGIDISYEFEAVGQGYTGDQKSQIRFVNNDILEPSV